MACSDYSPKPKAFPRVYYPERSYQRAELNCAFDMEIPSYSSMSIANPNEDCWYNINYGPFDATLHLSYKTLHGIGSLDSLMDDAYNLAFKHISKAEDIVPREFSDSSGNYGMIYDLYGKTATPFNFFITDEKKHFLRGSFYFNQRTDRDSVAPIYEFIKRDILHSINTLEWND